MTELEKAARQALEQAYLAGFNDSAEGYNGEYPFHGASPLKDRDWIERRDAYVRTAIETETSQGQEPVALGSEWVPCMKLPVVVHVRNQRLSETHVSTREGITPVKPDDLIMRGVSGEEYPIGRAIFEQTYTLDTTPPAAQPAAPLTGLDVYLDPNDDLKPKRYPKPAAQFAGSYGTIDESAAKRIATALGWEPKREWVALTQQDIDIAFDDTQEGGGFDDFARAIEAKLREKNGGGV